MTRKENVLKRYGLSGSYSKEDLAKITKVPLKIIQEVYNRGIAQLIPSKRERTLIFMYFIAENK